MTATIKHRPAGSQQVCWLTILLVLAGVCGCETKPPAPTATPNVDEGPQAKYDRVIKSLRDGLANDGPTGTGRFTFSDESGSASAAISYKIEAPEQIEPAAPGELPRATIRILQQASYSALTSPDQDDDEDQDRSSGRSRGGDDGQGLVDPLTGEVTDPLSGSSEMLSSAASRIKAPDITSRTVSADKQVVYELIYENKRWRMAVPPAADAPESTNMALQLALKRQ